MQLKIEKISAKGEGIAVIGNKNIIIPQTLPGEEVELDIDNKRKEVKEILTKSMDRITPPCQYFGECGGCSLQHMSQQFYREFKKNQAIQSLKKVNYSYDNFEIFYIDFGKRRRASLKAYLDSNEVKLGFFKKYTHEIVDIDQICLLLEDDINKLLPILKEILSQFNQIILSNSPLNINITNCSNGIDIAFITKYLCGPKEKKLLSNLPENVIRVSWITDQIEEIYVRDLPIIKIDQDDVFLPLDSFLQVSNDSQQIMINFIKSIAKNFSKILDLYSGIGTFAIPLAKDAEEIFAIEGNKNILKTTVNYSNISALVKDLYKNPLKQDFLDSFELVIINPPRNGASPQIINLGKSNVKNIILVSCDLDSFIRDSTILKKYGFIIEKSIAIDQFCYSHHLEMLAHFKR